MLKQYCTVLLQASSSFFSFFFFDAIKLLDKSSIDAFGNHDGLDAFRAAEDVDEGIGSEILVLDDVGASPQVDNAFHAHVDAQLGVTLFAAPEVVFKHFPDGFEPRTYSALDTHRAEFKGSI